MCALESQSHAMAESSSFTGTAYQPQEEIYVSLSMLFMA
jgi:hypothetical protein